MLISRSHRFIFIHVGKTAGMSMREVLKPYSQEPDKFRIRRPSRELRGQPNPLYSVWETILLHAKARDVARELAEEFDSFFKFAFVRNPWDLLVSLYHFMLREPQAARHDEVKATGTFEGFLRWAIATPDPFPKGIAKLQSEMLVDDGGRLLMDFIGYYETLREDFAEVCRRVNIEATLPHLNRSRHEDYRQYYTTSTRDLVAEHFRNDIELFGYTFDGRNRLNTANEFTRKSSL